MGTRDAAHGPRWSELSLLSLLVLVVLGLLLSTPSPPAYAQQGQDQPATEVGTEAEFRTAWAYPTETHVELTGNIFLHQCKTGDPIRESPYPLKLDGDGHTIRQTCFEKRVLRQDGTGFLLIKDVTLTRGGSDGPGAALTSRGEIKIVGSKIQQNLSEEPGGGVFSMRRITVRESVVTNNRANDRGGALGDEADVFVINSTIARNAAVAHVAGGIFSRGNLYVANSTVSNNYAEGQGGGILGGGMVRLQHSSILNNTAPVAANVGAGEGLESYGSVIGPAKIMD